MAISTNVLLLGLSGSIADQLTVKNYNGKAVVSKKVGPRVKPATEKQEDNEDLFKVANEVVKERYADLQKRYEAQMRLKVPPGRSLYRAMLKEFYKKEAAEYK
ncbi:hypothetical protein MKQ70_21440 [Chitinophaga sedimenti]|uniref:hypothetical protein n=1 Tax=Chitinophaga sedimenti TaxID=2033606 RepID=UPI002004084D|nr:hypothetical protein [Chitinophaga sedimenti]MCK7557428.1 hypothetical protein [Chitinophaga sedimenti]